MTGVAERAPSLRDLSSHFAFGQNWASYADLIDDERLAEAERGLVRLLGPDGLRGRSFLDIGCGSGLHAVAAARLGAARILAVDIDPRSVDTARAVLRRHAPQAAAQIRELSVFDLDPIATERFEVVYSWGVLHHTGAMWTALDHAAGPVRNGGTLFIAIYNDVGSQSVRWRRLKHIYARLPRLLQPAFALLVSAPQEFKSFARSVLSGRPQEYLHTWTRYQRSRGMSHWHDIVDWVGGFPYEYAKPDAIFGFFRARGFSLEAMKIGGGLGCSEYVFSRIPAESRHGC
jgi:2-polyprenyl-3-methyl-5-hydroxy-6-metoxy-1,4-benzoquinol methylase